MFQLADIVCDRLRRPGIHLAGGRRPCETPALRAAETPLVEGAGPRRRADFAVGRAALRRALADAGAPADPVLAGRRGQPLPPAGYHASLAHSPRFVLAAATAARGLLGLGVDVEEAALPAETHDLVLTDGERRPPADWRRPDADWFRLVFSAKECIFKAQYPYAGAELEFSEFALVTLAGNRWRGVAQSRAARRLTATAQFAGCFAFADDALWCLGTWRPASA